jgi:type IV pilus assembly protein PilE
MSLDSTRTLAMQFSRHRPLPRGFTLIELMITVAIIAILASVALPAYTDYIMRGRVADATQALSSRRAAMEQYFQDQRSYAAPAAGSNINYPCANPPLQVAGGTFSISCAPPGGVAPTATTYTITATGQGAAAGFVYTIDQNDTQLTLSLPKAWGTPPATGWVLRKGETP